MPADAASRRAAWMADGSAAELYPVRRSQRGLQQKHQRRVNEQRLVVQGEMPSQGNLLCGPGVRSFVVKDVRTVEEVV